LPSVSAKGCCPKCGRPWARIVTTETIRRERPNDRIDRHAQGDGVNSCGNTVAAVDTSTLGWRPQCDCNAGEAVPCLVLDPCGGAGTTAVVAQEMGLRWLLVEPSETYIDTIAAPRVARAQRPLPGVLA